MSKTALLDDLRRRIAHLEHPALERESGAGALSLGVAEIDGHLPWGGLAPAALHEIVAPRDAMSAPALGFAAALMGLAARRAPVLWCRAGEDLLALGLKDHGLNTDNLILVNSTKERELLWAMEEGLRSGALAAVLGELRSLPPTAARRLQLAAESGKTLALLVRGGGTEAAGTGLTRWRVAAAASRHPLGPWPGAARWHLELQRCRGAEAGAWLVEWSLEGHDGNGKNTNRPARGFRLAAPFRDGPPRPAASGTPLAPSLAPSLAPRPAVKAG